MVVDLIIIAMIGLSTFLAYKKGLVNLAIGLVAFIISVLITVILYQPIANLIINGTNMDETIENVIYEKANGVMQENKGEDELTDSQKIDVCQWKDDGIDILVNLRGLNRVLVIDHRIGSMGMKLQITANACCVV